MIINNSFPGEINCCQAEIIQISCMVSSIRTFVQTTNVSEFLTKLLADPAVYGCSILVMYAASSFVVQAQALILGLRDDSSLCIFDNPSRHGIRRFAVIVRVFRLEY